MKTVSWRACGVLFLAGLAWLSGCSARLTANLEENGPLPPAPQTAQERIGRTGYTVQVGAFSVLENALNLARTLNSDGLDAFYFLHGSGLYKVRFGDFVSREAADRQAKQLLDKDIIDEYFIVNPEDYAVVQRTALGENFMREKLVATAVSFIGVEYSWGGTLPFDGLDCSGLARAVYKLNGLNLPRSSAEQYEAGTAVARGGLMKGDLVFFSAPMSRRISHVGIYVGDQAFIHAPGKDRRIRKDSLDDQYFRENFSGARNYLN